MSAALEDGMSRDARVHRALSSPVRARILDELRKGAKALDVHTLAGLLGLHANTVRVHLSVLADADLVTSQPEERDRPGRPRLVYRAVERDLDHEPTDSGRPGGYAFLAEVLASHLSATAPDPAAAAEQAGFAWGRYLVDRPAPFQRIDPADAIERIYELLDDFGFQPELDHVLATPDVPGAADVPERAQWADSRHGADSRQTADLRATAGSSRGDLPAPTSNGDGSAGSTRVLLHRCPFLQVAGRHQEVVCSIHLGLMRGALEQLGGAVTAEDLQPFVEPDLCVSHLGLAS